MLTQIQSKILPLIKSLLKSNIFQFIGDNIHIFKDLSFMQDQCEKVSKCSERSEVYLHKIFIKWTVEIPGLRKASYFQTKTYQHINKFHFLSLCFHFTSHIHTHRAKIPNVEKNAKKKKKSKNRTIRHLLRNMALLFLGIPRAVQIYFISLGLFATTKEQAKACS